MKQPAARPAARAGASNRATRGSAPKAKSAARGTKRQGSEGPKLSRTRQPEHLAPAEWQRALRVQFGREQTFALRNVGDAPVCSEFLVTNAESRSTYRVAIRGEVPGSNYCACADFATNDLGTCKHVEFTLAQLRRKRGGVAALARGRTPDYSEIHVQYGAERGLRFRPGKACTPAVRRAAAKLFDPAREWTLAADSYTRLDGFVSAARRQGHEVRVYEDALELIARRRDTARRERDLATLYPKGAADAKLKRLLSVRMYRYQAEGALFAVRAGRVLIGDEMGLGKTLQAIAAMLLFARHFGVARVLVVCPTSLKYQWQSEIARFSGVAARVLNGGRARRQLDFAQDDLVKITNFEKLQRDLDLIDAWAPQLVIVDEAQRIKNWNTVAARALKRIDSPYAVVLTGTPLENKLEELLSIVQFVDRHRLGPTWRLLHEHQVRDEGGRVTGYTRLTRIAEALAPIMVRRRKAEVLTQLPARQDTNLLVPMTRQQSVFHDENQETVARIVRRWRKTGFLSELDQRRLTCALQNMRMSCVSTYLLDHETDHGTKADELVELLGEFLANEGEKSVVFSQWLGTQEIVARRLDALGIGYVRFHGSVASEARPALIEKFRVDPACRVFLSTDAGSTGLNLQCASLLVNMDLPWNPAVLEQRSARIHRMGQQRAVRIVNFVSKGTIEEGMLSVLAFKRSLAAGILDGGDGEITLGGTRAELFMKEVASVTEGLGPVPDDDAATGQEEVPEFDESARDTEPAGTSTDDRADATQADAHTQAAPNPDAGPARRGPDAAADAGLTTANRTHAHAQEWSALIDAGERLLGALLAASAGAPRHLSSERDDDADRMSLRLPLPPPETIDRLADVLSSFAMRLRGHGPSA